MASVVMASVVSRWWCASAFFVPPRPPWSPPSPRSPLVASGGGGVPPVVAVCLHWWRWWPVPRWRSPFRRPRPRWWRWWYKVFPPPRPSLVAVVVVAVATGGGVPSPVSRPSLYWCGGLHGLGLLFLGVKVSASGGQCLGGGVPRWRWCTSVVISSVSVAVVAFHLHGLHGLQYLGGVPSPVFETGGQCLHGHFL